MHLEAERSRYAPMHHRCMIAVRGALQKPGSRNSSSFHPGRPVAAGRYQYEAMKDMSGTALPASGISCSAHRVVEATTVSGTPRDTPKNNFRYETDLYNTIITPM